MRTGTLLAYVAFAIACIALVTRSIEHNYQIKAVEIENVQLRDELKAVRQLLNSLKAEQQPRSGLPRKFAEEFYK